MKVRVACLGAGWATSERHIPALLRDPRVELVGVVDKHAERAAAVASRHHIPNSGVSLDEEWAAGITGVTIGAPPLEHARLVEEALGRRLHCLCEKPFVLPASQGIELADRSAGAGTVLAVMHNFQYSRGGARLFELVEGGALGSVTACYGFQLSNDRRRLPEWRHALPGGLFTDETPHLLYLARRVLGSLDVRLVDARLKGDEIRQLVATLDHPTIWASLTLDLDASISEWQFVVVGERSVAALDIFRDTLLVVPNDGSHGAREVSRTSAALVSGHIAGFVRSGARRVRNRLHYGNDVVVERFVDAVTGEPERLAWLGARDGVAVCRALEDLLAKAGIERPFVSS